MKYTYEQIKESDDRIWELFKGQCVRCLRPAQSIHEINPRSLNVDWLKDENRVPLCVVCHSWAHAQGTKQSAFILKQDRRNWLIIHGR